MKKVLIASPYYLPFIGGQSVQTYLMAKAFMEEGYTVEILTFVENGQMDINGYKLNKIKSIKYGSNNIMRDSIGVIKMLYFLLRNLRSYELIIIRTFNVVSVLTGTLKFFRLLKINSIVLTDTITEIPDLYKKNFARVWIFLILQNNVINAINQQVFFQLQKLGASLNKLSKIPNCIKVFNDATLIEGPKKINKFCFIGNISAEKGIFDVLDVFSSIADEGSDVYLDIFGYGKDLDDVKSYIYLNDKEERIRTFDFTPFDKIQEIYMNYHCLIFASYHEGFGMVPFEAAQFNLEIVVSNVADIEKYLKKRAHFFNPGDKSSLYRILKALVAQNEGKIYSNSDWLEQTNPKNVISKLISSKG